MELFKYSNPEHRRKPHQEVRRDCYKSQLRKHTNIKPSSFWRASVHVLLTVAVFNITSSRYKEKMSCLRTWGQQHMTLTSACMFYLKRMENFLLKGLGVFSWQVAWLWGHRRHCPPLLHPGWMMLSSTLEQGRFPVTRIPPSGAAAPAASAVQRMSHISH